MEYRYYITTALVIITLQLLIYLFTRTIFWLFGDVSNRKARIGLSAFFFIAANGTIIITLLRIFPHMFRVSAIMLLILLFAAFTSIGAIAIYHLLKSFVSKQKLNTTLKILYPFVFIGLLGFSIFNAYSPVVKHYSITLDKTLSKPLRIGVASDLHLGILFGNKQLDKLADIMNAEKVDLILLPGDLMDDNVEAYLAENMQPHLAKLRAPLGVYATLGNHDLFGHQQAIYQELTKAGIHVLMDQTLNVNNQFVLVGRNDDLMKTRPSLAQLLQNIDTELPIFVMDHRPTEIEEHAKLPIDLQVSGHTHRGQVFPASILTKLIYRLHYGYEKIEKGHFFVTSGYGFWGVPMRLGSRSEVFIIDVK
ncbi:metallophosphoesterase [Conservatibacter flavescens]|uniref:Metallophosphoesterase n=1 Tax=Conservatibacter flavescens TaxID=28161 RepID=A0A2M8S0L0_9PAST|nr:metallophosphoesterase [Conservatibacter flavescens]PJG84677.1 metallophosphoesterase [Conservatibacter flavescens]